MLLKSKEPKWRKWFAFLPVPINTHGDRVWLQIVERIVEFPGNGSVRYRYRLSGSLEEGLCEISDSPAF